MGISCSSFGKFAEWAPSVGAKCVFAPPQGGDALRTVVALGVSTARRPLGVAMIGRHDSLDNRLTQSGFFVFNQFVQRPARYFDPSLFDTIPSRPILHAFRNTAAPSPSIDWLSS